MLVSSLQISLYCYFLFWICNIIVYSQFSVLFIYAPYFPFCLKLRKLQTPCCTCTCTDNKGAEANRKIQNDWQNLFCFAVRINSINSYPKDALFLGELSWAERPEVDVGFTAGDDAGAVVGVKLHGEHSLVGTLKTQQHTQKKMLNVEWLLH